MADYIDPQNREIKTTADEMRRPTAPALREMQVVIDKLIDKIEALNKETSSLSTAIGGAVKSTEGLGNKIEALSKVMNDRLAAAAAAKSGAKTKKSTLTEEGLKKILTEALAPSKELIEIHEKVVSRHTIYVRDDRMFQATRVLINTVENLNTQIGGMAALRTTRSVKAAAASSAKNDDIIAAAEASGRVEPIPGGTSPGGSTTASKGGSAAEIDYEQFKNNATQSARSLGQTKGEWFEIIEAIEKSELIKTRTGELDKKHVKQLALMAINSQRYGESQRKLIAKELEMIRLKQEEGKSQAEIDLSIQKLLKLLKSVNESVDLEKKLVHRLRDEWFGTLKTVGEYKQAAEDATVQLAKNIKSKIVAGLKAIPAALGAISGADKVFEGVLMNNAEFDKSLASVGYAKGQILDSTRDQVLAESDVLKTGQREEVLHKALLKNTQKGFNNQKKTLSMTREGVRLGTMIGADAEQTADFLGSWSQSMRMSTEQSKMFSRQLHTVGGITGVVGDDLLSAAKSSESITKNLRNLGRLDVNAASGITQLLAEAKKGGVEGEMTEFASKMSSPSALQGDSKAFTLAMQAAQRGGVDIMKVRSGNGLSAGEDRKGMGRGMQSFLDQTLSNLLTADQKARGVNFENLHKEANADDITLKLDAILRSATDKSAGEINALAKALIESGKTSAEILQDIDTKLQKQNLSSKERQNLTQQKERLTFNEFAAHAAALSDAAEKNGEAGILAYLDDAKNKEDLVGDLERDGVTNARSMSRKELSAQLLNKIGAAATTTSDADGYQVAITEALEKRGEKEVQEKAESNPFIKAELTMRELNETIAQKIADPLKRIADWLGGYGIALVTALGSIGSGVGGGLISGLLGRLLGGGGSMLMKMIGGGAGLLRTVGGGVMRVMGGSVMRMVGGTLLRGVVAALGSAVALKGIACIAAGAVGYGAGWLIRQIPGVEPALEGMGASVANWWDGKRVAELEKHNQEAIAAVRAEEQTPEYKEAQKRHKDTITSYEELDKALIAGNKEAAKQHMKIILENTIKTGGSYESSLAQAKAAEVAKFAGPDAAQDVLAEQIANKAKVDELRDSLSYKYNSRGQSGINKTGVELAAVESHNRAIRAEMEAETVREAAKMNLNVDGTYIKKPEPLPPSTPPVPVADAKLPANNEAAIEDKLRQERASNNKDSAGTAVAEGIGHVEENTATTVEELRKLHIEMKQLVALFKNNVPSINDDISNMAKNDASAKRKPKTSTNFHQWQVARYTSNPAKGVMDNLV